MRRKYNLYAEADKEEGLYDEQLGSQVCFNSNLEENYLTKKEKKYF